MLKRIYNSKLFLVFSIIIPIVILDHITKQLIHRNFKFHESMQIIPGFFNLTYVRNLGAAWGLFSDANDFYRIPFFWTISILAIIGISVWLYLIPFTDKLKIFTLSLILSGAIGNFLDRTPLFHSGGYVIDFLDFYITFGNKTYHWPAFNVADSAISISIFLLLIVIYREEKEKKASLQK